MRSPTDPPPAAAPTPEPLPPFRVVGYVSDWGLEVTPDQIAKLTHLNYAFAVPNPDGTLEPPPNEWKLQQYVRTAHAQGVPILLAVGGWGYDAQFETLATSPTARATFIQQLVAYVNANDLDGIDMDWEYPDPGASSDNFLALMQELRAALDASSPPSDKKLLTAAVAAYGDNADGVPNAVYPHVDFLNLMAYADSGAHHSPYVLAETTLDYWQSRGLARSKMVLGVPFYAQPGDIAYRTLVANDASNANADTTNYLGGAVTYNGIPTIRAKTRLAHARASGIMIWTINDDSTDTYSLLNTIVESAP